MATSIDDLLAALDQQSRRPNTAPTDADRALQSCARLLTRLRSDSVSSGEARRRDDAVRRLADACSQASIAFDGGTGRASELVAVTSDAVGRMSNELTDSDRWAIAVRLTSPARRWAGVIAASGPYADVPQLLGVADRARELSHVAAAVPPELAELRGIDQPIPAWAPARPLSPIADITEATARLVAEFRRGGRDRMTARELVAVCHVATRVAEYAEALAGMSDDKGAWSGPWRTARDTVAMYADGVRPGQPGNARSHVLDSALRADAAVRRAGGAPQQDVTNSRSRPDKREITGLARLLQHAARHCAIEFGRIKNSLYVPPGSKPLSENRVGEWLRHEPFLVQPPDLVPATESLRQASEASIDLARGMQLPLRVRSSESTPPSAEQATSVPTL
ncbi:MAG: hypothetical protein ACRDWT_11430 [Jatrophihabitantaceae bacterium]